MKRDVYERTGVEEYWLVVPEREVIEVYRRGVRGFQPSVRHARPDIVTTPLLPGLEIPRDKILA